MNKKILIVDDEERIRNVVADFLVMNGYVTKEASDGIEALAVLDNDHDIGLVITDVMMPRMDGFMLCKSLRKDSNIPIVVLTAKTEEKDELEGFNLGIDEYITKPFSATLLLARVNAIYNRTYGEMTVSSIKKGELTIYHNEQKIEVNGVTKELSKNEMKLLLYLVRNESIVFSREKLLDDIWSFEYTGTDRTVDTHINRLRIKMDSAGQYIKTIHRVGYKFEVKGD